MKLEHITIEQTLDIIKKAKGTNSVGPDNITMKTIKKLGPAITPHLTQLINCIINSQTYPEILQISRITHNSKPEKDPSQISSYIPLNNLSTIDKKN